MKKLVCLVLALVMVLACFAASAEEERVKLKVVFPGNIQAFIEGEDENNNFVIDYIEEGTGLDVEWMLLPNEDGLSKLNLIMAAQEADVIFYNDYQTLLNYFNDGLLATLNDYLPAGTLSPDVEELTDSCTMGADKFAVFYADGLSGTTWVWMYNKVLLDEAGIEIPEKVTLDDFTNILYEIKDAYPDKIPLTAVGSGTSNMFLNGMQNIYGAFGIANALRETADGSLEYTGVSEDMRECIEYLAKLYADGIIDPEYLVNTKDTIVPKIINEQVVSVNAAWYDYTGTYSVYMIDDAEELVDWGQTTIIYGDRPTTGQSVGNRTRKIGVVSRQCQNIEAAVKLLAFMSTDDFYFRLMYGEPGVDSIRDESGKYVLQDTPVGRAYSTNGSLFHNYYSVKESVELRCLRLEPNYPSYERYKCDILNFYEPKEVINPVEVHPYTPAYDDIVNTLNDIFANYFTKIIVGEYAVEKFDDMVAEFDAAGGYDAVDALNEWYLNP